MDENAIAKLVVGAAYKIHKKLGPGLLESVYLAVLAYELRTLGLEVVTEIGLPVIYEDVALEIGFRADMVINNLVIAELKSVEQLALVHRKQLLTYLRLSGKRLGLLINFGAPLIKDNIIRIVNGLPA
jgi:GxxExxY protein